MDPYAADSKVVDSDQIRSEPKAALKQGKSACLKLEGQGQKISIKGAERNAAKVEVGSSRRGRRSTTVGSLSGDQPNRQLGRATMPSLWCRKYMLVIQLGPPLPRNEPNSKLEGLKIFLPPGALHYG